MYIKNSIEFPSSSVIKVGKLEMNRTTRQSDHLFDRNNSKDSNPYGGNALLSSAARM